MSAEFPRIVYRPGGRPGQIDHPGFEAKRVEDSEQCAAALAAGWTLTPEAKSPEPEPVADPVDEAPKKGWKRK